MCGREEKRKANVFHKLVPLIGGVPSVGGASCGGPGRLSLRPALKVHPRTRPSAAQGEPKPELPPGKGSATPNLSLTVHVEADHHMKGLTAMTTLPSRAGFSQSGRARTDVCMHVGACMWACARAHTR